MTTTSSLYVSWSLTIQSSGSFSLSLDSSRLADFIPFLQQEDQPKCFLCLSLQTIMLSRANTSSYILDLTTCMMSCLLECKLAKTKPLPGPTSPSQLLLMCVPNQSSHPDSELTTSSLTFSLLPSDAKQYQVSALNTIASISPFLPIFTANHPHCLKSKLF